MKKPTTDTLAGAPMSALNRLKNAPLKALLISIGFCFWSSTTFAYTSEFAIPITLPDCNKADPAVQIIETNADWAKVNDSSKKIFCVAPGDYTDVGSIVLTESGTETDRRYITLLTNSHPAFDDITENPVNQAKGEQAIVKQIRIVNANYWVINRLVQRGADSGGGYIIGDNNIFNNMLFELAPRIQLVMYNGSDKNVVQYSVCREQTEYRDAPCFGISDNIGPEGTIPTGEYHTLGNRFVSNEIYDYTDGIQLIHSPSDPGVGRQDMSGTIIDNNDIYITEKRYVDSDGKSDPNGEYACAENGIDVKIGGSGSSLSRRVTISNNRIWGMRRSNCPTMSDAGTAIGTVQSGVTTNYLYIEGNILFSNARGMNIGKNQNTGIIIVNNIITDSRPSASAPKEFGIASPEASIGNPMLIYGNAISGHYYWTGAEANKEYQCNYILNSTAAPKRILATGSNNSYFVNDYMANHIGGDISNDQVGLPSDARFEDACFAIKAITNPHVKCLKNAVPSPSTPKAQQCTFNVKNLITNYSAPSTPEIISIEKVY